MPKSKSTLTKINPQFLYSELLENKLKPELEIVARFLSFSNELLRMSLSDIVAISFLYQFIFTLNVVMFDPVKK